MEALPVQVTGRLVAPERETNLGKFLGVLGLVRTGLLFGADET